MRHPQYLGILLVTAGWLVHWPTIPGLLMWPVLVVLYYRLARREDADAAAHAVARGVRRPSAHLDKPEEDGVS